MTNSPKESITVADKGKYISSDTGSREITNEMYDFNKVSSHKIIQSAVSLEESDSIKSLGNNMYMVPSDYADENITETYSDDVITVSGSIEDTEIKNEYDSQESALKKYLDGENTTGNDLRVAVIDSGISGYGTDNRMMPVTLQQYFKSVDFNNSSVNNTIIITYTSNIQQKQVLNLLKKRLSF